ncbi:MAG: APC family permease [Mycoplasma sp.]|nr:APC family permease [Candidatus Hennigella equi]
MPKVSKQTAGKIGLFTAVMMIFGTLVGIGIFFKNYSVFNNNHGNPIGILLSWIIAIILVMSIALSFCEISSCKIKNKADGFGGWSERFLRHGLGRYNKLGYSLIFYTVNTFAIMFFTGEGCLNCFSKIGQWGNFDFGHLTTLYVFLAGGALFTLFIFLNIFASKGMTRFSNATGIIKFVPIAMVVILGITFGIIGGHQGGLWNGHWYTIPSESITPEWTTTGNIDITGIITSIPSILFAFEGYLVVGNIACDMDKPEKNVPLSMVIALIVVSSLYLVITIACMTVGTGNVYQLMEICFEGNQQLINILSYVISVLIFICIIGVLNAITFTGMRAFQAGCEEGNLFKGKQLVAKKPNNKLFAGGIWFLIAVGVWWACTLIPSAILNTDQIVDACSYIMIIGLYVMYVFVMLPALANRKTKKVEVTKNKIFIPACVIALIGCSFIIVFCGFYKFLARPIELGLTEGWNNVYKDCGWGLFVNNTNNTDFKLNYWHSIIVYWSIFIFLLASPFINDLLIKWFDKSNKQILIWQK